MHLSHTIPWNGLSRHFTFIRENKALYGSPSGLFPTKDDREATDAMHFVRVFADTIDKFAITERSKFPAKMDVSLPLFSDDLLDHERFHLEPYASNDNRAIPLERDMQQVQFWEKQAEDGFGTAHGFLADAVKFLIQQHESRALLTLCQAVPLARLYNLSWGHGFGVYLNAYFSFRIYLALNLAYAVQQDELVKGKNTFKIFDLPDLRREVLSLMDNCDFSAQYIAHRQFWEKFVQNPSYNGEGTIIQDPAEVDAGALKQYLANCFRDIYLYDMMLKESGEGSTKAFWVNEMVLTMNFMYKPLSLPQQDMY